MTEFNDLAQDGFETLLDTFGPTAIDWTQNGTTTAVAEAIKVPLTRAASADGLDLERAHFLVRGADVPATPSPGLVVTEGGRTWKLVEEDGADAGQGAFYHAVCERRIRRAEP